MEMVLKQFHFEDSCYKVIGRVTYENVAGELENF